MKTPRSLENWLVTTLRGTWETGESPVSQAPGSRFKSPVSLGKIVNKNSLMGPVGFVW